MLRKSLVSRVVVVTGLGFATAGCFKWQVEQVSPAELMLTRPKAIRVESRDGSVVELVRPEVTSDSISGLVPGSAPGGAPLRRVSVPLDEIHRLASKRGDTRRIIAGVLAGPVAYVAGAFMLRW